MQNLKVERQQIQHSHTHTRNRDVDTHTRPHLRICRRKSIKEKRHSQNCFWCSKAFARRITMREVSYISIFSLRELKICLFRGSSSWCVCVRTSLIWLCHPNMRAPRGGSATFCRHWAAAHTAECRDEGISLLFCSFSLSTYVDVNVYVPCMRSRCAWMCVCAYWDYVPQNTCWRIKWWNLETFRNDMICSIENNEWVLGAHGMATAVNSNAPTHEDVQGESKATATTANHSKSNYGIHFSYMFSTCERT